MSDIENGLFFEHFHILGHFCSTKIARRSECKIHIVFIKSNMPYPTLN